MKLLQLGGPVGSRCGCPASAGRPATPREPSTRLPAHRVGRLRSAAALAALWIPLAVAGGGTPGWSEGFEDPEQVRMTWGFEGEAWDLIESVSAPHPSLEGSYFAATVFAGESASRVRSVLRSPSFFVSERAVAPRIRFWQWYFLDSVDVAEVWAQPYRVEFGRKTELNAVKLATIPAGTTSGAWVPFSLDLTAFLGQEIEILFVFDDQPGGPGSLWCLDDLSYLTEMPRMQNPETWESGFENWHTIGGAWRVGTPGGGKEAVSGVNVASTVISSFDGSSIQGELVSPRFAVPFHSPSFRLRFRHWYDLQSGAEGSVWIRVLDRSGDAFRPQDAVRVGPVYTAGQLDRWESVSLDLEAYRGRQVEVLFRFSGGGDIEDTSVWMVDDVAIETGLLGEIPDVRAAEHELIEIRLPDPRGARFLELTPLGAEWVDLAVMPGDPPLLASGAVLESDFGLFSWVPREQQGPAVHRFRVGLVDEQEPLRPVDVTEFSVRVEEINSPPVIEPLGTIAIRPEIPMEVTVRAKDLDFPSPGALVFSLVEAPDGATIEAGTGRVRWTPNRAQAKERHRFVVQVTDSGLPPRSSRMSFSALRKPRISRVRLDGPWLEITFEDVEPKTDYVLQGWSSPAGVNGTWSPVAVLRWDRGPFVHLLAVGDRPVQLFRLIR